MRLRISTRTGTTSRPLRSVTSGSCSTRRVRSDRTSRCSVSSSRPYATRPCDRSSRSAWDAASPTCPSTPMAREMAASLTSISGMCPASPASAGHALSRRRKAPRASLPARSVSATARSSSPVSTPPLAARCASVETLPASPNSMTPPVSRNSRASAVSRCRSATASAFEDGVRASASRRPSSKPACDANCESTAGNSSSSSERARRALCCPTGGECVVSVVRICGFHRASCRSFYTGTALCRLTYTCITLSTV